MMVRVQSAFGRVTFWIASGWALAACGHDAESASQSARIAVLEEQVRRLGTLSTAAAATPPPTAAPAKKPFTIECPQPWVLHPPIGATLWNCRSPTPTPEGFFPQCSMVMQPQVAIELGTYFEYAWNASPQLHQVKNVKDKPIKIKDHDGFEGTFEAEPKSVPMKMRSVLIPHAEQIYAITCFAPSTSFDSYEAKAFRKITDTIAFPQ